MLSALIVDDEKYIREELKYLLDKIGAIEVVGEAGEGEVVIPLIQKNRPDVVFLDIHLQDTSGLLLARKILDLENPPFIILATAYDKYALHAFEINALDYLLKPFCEERVRIAIDRLKRQNGQMGQDKEIEETRPLLNKLFVSRTDRFVPIPIEEIQYIEAVHQEIFVYTEKEKNHTSHSLKELEEKLPATQFVRTHKSFIVNLDYIEEIIPWFNYTYKVKVRGKEGVEIPVSRSYLKRFKKLLSI